MREYCPQCEYPISTCLCDSVSHMGCPFIIDILQHRSEKNAAKNTARLVKLCIPDANIWVGEGEKDFEEIRKITEQSPERFIVVFPNDRSKAYSQEMELRSSTNSRDAQPRRVIFIDGTWKKAYKMWQLNPWLHSLPSVHFTNVESAYDIRKAPKENQLSTLECVAHFITLYAKNISTKPLDQAFNAMKSHFQNY